MSAPSKPSQSDHVIVPEHVHGFPDVAFGGYVAGVLATYTEALDGVRVDFRRGVTPAAPVPVSGTAEGGVQLADSDGQYAVAHPRAVQVDIPEAPSWEEALAASHAYRMNPPPGQVDCFGCGLDRTPERGLRQFTAPVPGRDLVAAAWVPHPALAGEDGSTLPPEMIWAALDCPGSWACRTLGSAAHEAVTASLTAKVLRPVEAGTGYISYGWVISDSGRKHVVGTALTTEEGALCAVAEALWVSPRRG